MSDFQNVDAVRHIDALRQLPLFRPLETAVLSKLLSSGQLLQRAKGQIILQEGDPATLFYVLLKGKVCLYTIDVCGSMNTLALPEAPAVLAITAMFHADAYPATCEALCPCTVLALPRRATIDLLMREPAARIAVLRTLATSWNRLYEQSILIRSKTPLQRLIGYLLGLSDASEDCHRIELPISKQRLASQIGITSENLSRTFAQLEEHGVWRRNGAVEIDDPEQLRKLYAA